MNKQEPIQYGHAKTKALIRQQLHDIDRAEIRAKAEVILEKDIAELQRAVTEHHLTYEQLVAFYLDRIERSLELNAVIEISPTIMAEAKKCDQERPSDPDLLYGMPLTLKDNIASVGMPFSVGTYYLREFMPPKDAQLVTQLKEQGALILGKANLSELANYVSPAMPSGYSSKAGQTRNPFGPLTLTPSGSSSGSAAGVAAELSVASIGSETTGSIVSPAAIQSVVGFKPSQQAISAKGVFPLATPLDVTGPLTKNVFDAAVIYNAMAKKQAPKVELAKLKQATFSGKRLGVLTGDEKLITTLQNLGATLCMIELDPVGVDNLAVIDNNFKFNVAEFAAEFELPFKSLEQLLAYNAQDLKRRARYGQELVERAAKVSEHDPFLDKKQLQLAQKYLLELFEREELDAIVTLDYDDILTPAVAGYPEVMIPFGRNAAGEPRGVLFFAKAKHDPQLLELAYAFEQGTNERLVPQIF